VTGQRFISILILVLLLFLSFLLEPGKVGPGAHFSALMIVLGGTVCATLMGYPLKRVLGTLLVLKRSLLPGEKSHWIIQEIVGLAREYRRGWDVRHLEERLKKIPPGLLSAGVEMIVYRYGREKMESALREQALCIRREYESSSGFLDALSQIVPSVGLIWTILHFVSAFGFTRDVQDLAGCAAAAFLSTLYGLLLGRVVLVCLSQRLKEFTSEESFRMDLIREGILDVRDEEHPRAIQFKLESRVSTKDVWNEIPKAPEVGLLSPEEMGLERETLIQARP